MEQSLITYSLIRALYDEGLDYIDSFWPFTLRVLSPDRTPMTPQTVADLVRERFDLAIPVHTTGTLLQRAKKRGGLVVRHEHAYSLSKEGVKYVSEMESERSVERRLTAFVDAASSYFASGHEIVADRAHAQRMIDRVVERSHEIFGFVVERPAREGEHDFTAEDQAVLGFFRHVEAAEPTLFGTLKDLILGSTLASLLTRTDIADATRSFKRTDLYFDTNFLLSALSLRFPVECRPALELLRLLNQNPRFNLHVFDFTLEEVFALLRAFAREGGKYPKGVPVQSLFASMKSQGYSPGAIPRLIANIESDLDDIGIGVVQTGVRLEDLEFDDPDTLTRHRVYKPDQEDRGRLHDLHAIALVAQLRAKEVRRVEDAGAFFLTEDTRLSKFAFIERGHRDRETVSEVMPDRLLTNLLWLKDPEVLKQLSIGTVIAMHSRDLFIHRSVWLRFFEVLKGLEVNGSLDADAAALLLYDAQVHRDLAGLGVGRASEVNGDWILERLEGAREQAELARAWELQNHAAALTQEMQNRGAAKVARIERSRAEAESQLNSLRGREQRREADIAKVLARKKTRVKRNAKRVVWAAKGAVLIGLLGMGGMLIPQILSNWEDAEPILTIIALGVVAASILGWRLDPFKLWQQLQQWTEGVLMTRALIDLGPIMSVTDPPTNRLKEGDANDEPLRPA